MYILSIVLNLLEAEWGYTSSLSCLMQTQWLCDIWVSRNFLVSCSCHWEVVRCYAPDVTVMWYDLYQVNTVI